MADKFIRDIRPFFLNRPVTYVEVGARRGDDFRSFVESGFNIIEAHLIEPDREVFEQLQHALREINVSGANVCLHRAVAVGSAGADSQVAEHGSEAEPTTTETGMACSPSSASASFEAPRMTVDSVRETLSGGRIHILQIDASSRGLAILAGAEESLRAQCVDVICIEAGLNPHHSARNHFRDIEDYLRAFGYRVFRLYQQPRSSAQADISPTRVQIVFLSGPFARDNPFQKTLEIYELHEAHKEAQEREARGRAELGDARARISELEQALQASEHARAAAEQALTRTRQQTADLHREVESLRQAERSAARRLSETQDELEKSGTKVQSLLLRLDRTRASRDRARREAERAAAKEGRLRSNLSYRIGSTVVQHGKTPLGWATMPGALVREYLGFRRSQPKSRVSAPPERASKGQAVTAPAKRPQAKASTSTRARTIKQNQGKTRRVESGERQARRWVSGREAKVWGGYARYAVPELQAYAADVAKPDGARALAHEALARWYYYRNERSRALEHISQSFALQPQPTSSQRTARLMCLLANDRHEEVLEQLMTTAPSGVSAVDLTFRAEAIRRKALHENKPVAELDDLVERAFGDVFMAGSLAPIRRKDPARRLSIGNLTCDVRAATGEQTIKVSVIIPAYNAEKTLSIALDSLLTQTWHNLEVLVVDDCSTDGTRALVKRYWEQDSRVRLVLREANGGAYAARNDGAMAATGELIMVHDADDWSHPQKIEIQVAAFQANPECLGVISHWLRVGEHLELVGPWRLTDGLFDLNFSSLLFRRSLLDEIGGWDTARVSGDAEFRWRIEAAFGKGSIVKVPSNRVLSFGLSREGSLTRTTRTHISSLFFGLRWHYRHAYRHWHDKIRAGADPHISRNGRPFPLPLGMRRSCGPEDRRFDLVVVCDFGLQGGAFESTINYALAGCDAGLRVAVVHWRRYDLDAENSPNPMLFDLCLAHGIEILTPGDEVATEFVLVGYPVVLRHKPDLFPQIDCREVLVVVNQYETRYVNGDEPQYSPWVARQHLAELFGTEGLWIPISEWVARLMEGNPRYTMPHPNAWFPLIDTQEWCSTPLVWRGGSGRPPIVGRHGRDARTKWPSTAAAIRAAYCVETDVEVRVLGGAKIAVDLLGGMPRNWSVSPYGEMSSREFLDELDFFLHFTHELYIEEFGRAVMEAMAAGKVAVLAPQFRQTFGDAAVYCEPSEVYEVVSALWRDGDRYLEQARRGREFVERNCDRRTFMRRLEVVRAALGERPATAAPACHSHAPSAEGNDDVG